jgi:hypothetical protein
MDENVSGFDIELNGKVININVIGQKQLDLLLAKPDTYCIQDSIFSNVQLKVYQIENGVVVVRDGEMEFPIYPSKDILIEQLLKHDSSGHIDNFINANPYGDSFPYNAAKIADKFIESLGISFKGSYNQELIKLIDDKMKENRNQSFLKDNYLSMIAVVGEAAINELGCSWIMIKSDSNGLYTPALAFNGEIIHFVHYILIDYNDFKEPSPLLNSYLSVRDIIQFNLKK